MTANHPARYRAVLHLALLSSAIGAGCGITDDAAWTSRVAEAGSAGRTFEGTLFQVARSITEATGGGIEIDLADLNQDLDGVDLDIVDGDKSPTGSRTIPMARDEQGRPLTGFILKPEDLPITRLEMIGKDAEGHPISARLEPDPDGRFTFVTIRVGAKEVPESGRKLLDRAGKCLEAIRREPPAAGPHAKAASTDR